MIKKLIFIINGIFVAVIASNIWLENFYTVGQICASQSQESFCDQKKEGTSRNIYFSISSCVSELTRTASGEIFICGAGMNFKNPDLTIYSGFREVYSSKTANIKLNNNGYFFDNAIKILIVGILLNICIFIYFKKSKSKSI